MEQDIYIADDEPTDQHLSEEIIQSKKLMSKDEIRANLVAFNRRQDSIDSLLNSRRILKNDLINKVADIKTVINLEIEEINDQLHAFGYRRPRAPRVRNETTQKAKRTRKSRKKESVQITA